MPKANNLRIDYVEFGCTDPARAKQFYNAVFGWQFEDYGPSYTSFSDGRIAGGFSTEVKPGTTPLVIMYAEDLEGTAAKIEAAGGKIVVPTFDFPGGRRFHFSDSEGNVLAVWSDPV
jgi:predicted enzyme related to lactoylglutathione lyase